MEWTSRIVAGFLVMAIAVGLGTKCYSKKKSKVINRAKSRENEKTKNETPTSRCMPMHSIIKGEISIPSKEEFENLLTFDGSLTQRATTSQGQRYNNKRTALNRVLGNLPFDHNRLVLKNPINNCNYVNANSISAPIDDLTYDELIYTSYQPFKKIEWAVGQNPLPHTMSHHFRLIHQCRFEYIISFGESTSKTLFKLGNKYHYDDFEVQVLDQKEIGEHLIRTEITVSNDSIMGYQYRHHATYFEFLNWPNEPITKIEETDELVSALNTIRNEIEGEEAVKKVFVHDSRGGVVGGAVFLIMYELLEQIDSSFKEDNTLKRGSPGIDIVPIVNRLRKDRAKMIEDYSTFQLLFYCIGNYGKNRVSYLEEAQRNMLRNATLHNRYDSDADATATNHSLYQNRPENDTYVAEDIEYVLHDPSDEERYSIFDEYDV